MAVYEDYQAHEDYYDEPQRNNRTWLIVAIVVVILLLCCCCLMSVAGLSLFSEDIVDGLKDIAGVAPALAGMTPLV
jgi:hypothetical protein